MGHPIASFMEGFAKHNPYNPLRNRPSFGTVLMLAATSLSRPHDNTYAKLGHEKHFALQQVFYAARGVWCLTTA